MKRITTFLIFIVFATNIHGQTIDSIIGIYSVTNIYSQVSGDVKIFTDTSFYKIKVEKESANMISFVNYYQLDTIKANVISDSIDIFYQTNYYSEWDYNNIHGYGKLYNDTIRYHYFLGGPLGLFEYDCVAVKIEENSINDLTKNKKNLIGISSLDNKLLNLRLINNIHGDIILYTHEGKQVARNTVTEKESIIFVPVSGLLLYRFETEKGEIQTGKVMVR